jgi:outer membrane lipopolysaccharide assembly protein LptE/RlpB
MMKKFCSIFYLVLLSSVLVACSGESFHLRGHGSIPSVNETLYLNGVSRLNPFSIALRDAIKGAGSLVTQNKSQASIQLNVDNINEGKIATGYSRARKVREYDIFLKLNYSFTHLNKGNTVLSKGTVNLSQTQLYDSDFALGKAEEEELIKQELRRRAAHLILTKLRYTKR